MSRFLQIVKPCGRINSLMVVARDILYLYGGMMEVGEREVTLDDLYTMDLNKLDAWNLVIEVVDSNLLLIMFLHTSVFIVRYVNSNRCFKVFVKLHLVIHNAGLVFRLQRRTGLKLRMMRTKMMRMMTTKTTKTKAMKTMKRMMIRK